MTVTVIGWNADSAVATVNGVRVRIRRGIGFVTWRCDDHGTGTSPDLCDHTRELAATTPPANKHQRPKEKTA